MRFAEKLKALRDSSGLTDSRLARRSGVAFGTLRGYLLGRRQPSFANVVRLAAALGVTCLEFVDCDEFRHEVEPAKSGSNQFGNNLARLRQKKVCSLKDLAESVGLTKTELRDLEEGHSQPTWDVVVKLAAALKVSVSEFSNAED